MADAETKTKGAIKGGNGKFIFQMMEMDQIEAGTGYSTAMGPVPRDSASAARSRSAAVDTTGGMPSRSSTEGSSTDGCSDASSRV